jgi:hypothetical protein
MSGHKIIVRSDEARALWPDTAEGSFAGIGQVTNEDPATDAVILVTSSTSDPGLDAVYTNGARLVRAEGNQTQYQDINNGTDPRMCWLAALPFPVAPDATVPAQGYACDDANTVEGWVAESFTQPAVDSTRAVTFLSTAWMAGLTADTDTGSEVYITGGGIYRLVSIDSPTVATLKNLGIAAAAVTLTYS